MSPPPQATPPDQSRVSRTEALLGGLALLAQLWWGPEPEFCQDLARGGFKADLEALGPWLDRPGQEAARGLLDWVRSRTGEELGRILEADYLRLFINSREGLKAPLYHSPYESPDGGLMGRPQAMMRDRLEAAGIDLRSMTREPADHLAVECEYLFFLLEAGLNHGREDLVAAGREFAAREMLPWVREFAGRLEEEREAAPFYPLAAALLAALLKALAQPEEL